MKTLLQLRSLESLNQDVAFALRALQLREKEAPSEFPLLMPGEWKGRVNAEGKMITLKVTPANIQDAFDYYSLLKSRNPLYEMPLDYEHQTFSGTEAPAAAWFDLSLRDGPNNMAWLWAMNVRWVPRAKTMVETGEYRFVSPAFVFGYPDPISGKKYSMAIMNAALTNNPFLKGELPPLLAKDIDVQVYLFQSHHHQQEEQMEQLLVLLVAFFSLAATAKPEDVVAKVNWLTEQLRAAGIVAKEGTALTAQNVIDQIKAVAHDAVTFKANFAAVAKAIGAADNASFEEVRGMIVALKSNGTSLQTLTAELGALKAGQLTDKFNGVLAKGSSTGRITPAQRADPAWIETQRAWAERSFDSFQNYFTTTAPVIVPVGQIEGVVTAKAGLTDEDNQVARQMGTIEQLKKYAVVATN